MDVKITAKLFASLGKDRFEAAEFTLPAGSSVADLIGRIGIPPAEVSVIFVNARHAEPVTILAAGDLVALFPPVGGG